SVLTSCCGGLLGLDTSDGSFFPWNGVVLRSSFKLEVMMQGVNRAMKNEEDIREACGVGISASAARGKSGLVDTTKPVLVFLLLLDQRRVVFAQKSWFESTVDGGRVVEEKNVKASTSKIVDRKEQNCGQTAKSWAPAKIVAHYNIHFRKIVAEVPAKSCEKEGDGPEIDNVDEEGGHTKGLYIPTFELQVAPTNLSLELMVDTPEHIGDNEQLIEEKLTNIWLHEVGESVKVDAEVRQQEMVNRNQNKLLGLDLIGFAREEGRMSDEVLRRSFIATEEGFLAHVTRSWKTKPLIAAVGSCCLVGVIWGEKLFIANVGDSRVVMGSLGRSNKMITAEQLTRDHNASVEEVRQELRALHPDDSRIVVHKHGVWRVKGIIQVSRSIGDVYLKKPEFNLDPIYTRFQLSEPLQRPVLTAEPSMYTLTMKPHDKFLIFASDGLWEHLTNQQAVEIVYNYPRL
ncbi:hypothetical protein KI387_024038, partial [Taxus chinensis]